MVAHVIDQTLEVIDWNIGLIQDDMVVDGASSALNGNMGTEVEVVLKSSIVSIQCNLIDQISILRMCNVVLDECAR